MQNIFRSVGKLKEIKIFREGQRMVECLRNVCFRARSVFIDALVHNFPVRLLIYPVKKSMLKVNPKLCFHCPLDPLELGKISYIFNSASSFKSAFVLSM
jgi:hypothetical protein